MKDETEDIPREFWEDMKWGREHFSDLMASYPDQWVAIVERKIVAVGKDLGKVIEEAKWKTKKAHTREIH